MGYIYGLIVSGLFFLAMHYFTELTKSQKAVATLVILTIISAAVAYNHQKKQEEKKMLDIVTRYKQGKTIMCEGREVNSSTYSLSVGTYTFIGKKNTPHYAEMVSASTCR